MIEFIQQYWGAIVVVLGVIVAAIYLWLTDRKRAEEIALLLAKQVVAFVVSTTKQVIQEIPDATVISAARQLYARLPAWARKAVSEAQFVEWALKAWQRFKDELARGMDAPTAIHSI